MGTQTFSLAAHSSSEGSWVLVPALPLTGPDLWEAMCPLRASVSSWLQGEFLAGAAPGEQRWPSPQHPGTHQEVQPGTLPLPAEWAPVSSQVRRAAELRASCSRWP